MYTNRKGIVFSQREVWNLSCYLKDIIFKGVSQFASSKRYGYPFSIHNYNGVEYKEISPLGVADVQGDDEELAIQEWEAVLTKIIYFFNADNEPDLDDPDYEGWCYKGEIIPDALYRYEADAAAWHWGIEEALYLLSKFMEDLWD